MRQRALVLLTFNLAMLAMLLLGLIAAIVSPRSIVDRTFGYPIIITTGLSLLANLMLLHMKGSYELSAKISIIVPYLSILASIVVTGGPLRSPAIYLWLLPTIASFYLLGLTRALKFNVLSISALILLICIDERGILLKPDFPADLFALLNIFVFLISLVGAISFAAMYEFSSNNLKHQRDEEHQRVIDMANNDLLTGIANRRRFEIELNESVRDAKTNPYFSLSVVDLNDFKPINDKHGHQVGDEVIKTVAKRIRDEIRDIDFVARMGGDEFVLIIRNVEYPQTDPMPLLQRVLKCIQQPIETSAGILQVTGSIGLALYPEHGTDLQTLLQAADKAMYTAKSTQQGIVTAINRQKC